MKLKSGQKRIERIQAIAAYMVYVIEEKTLDKNRKKKKLLEKAKDAEGLLQTMISDLKRDVR